MRYEQAVHLCSHEIREQILKLVRAGARNFSDAELARITPSNDAILDFLLICTNYRWPEHWSERRRVVMLYTCDSEFQLAEYLRFINDGCTGKLPPMDFACNAVANLRPYLKPEVVEGLRLRIEELKGEKK